MEPQNIATKTVVHHSDEIDEIITKVPSWILRWGITIFGGIALMAVGLSAVIRYPDTTKTAIRFQSTPKEIYGLIAVREDNSARLKIGQPVIIGLKFYPAKDYGRLRGVISFIPDAPNSQGFFIINIKLNNTHLKPPIKPKDWMTGNAEIITQDKTILQRITQSLIKGVK